MTSRGLFALLISTWAGSACGGALAPDRDPAPYALRAAPAPTPFGLLIVATAGVDEAELFGAYYGAAAMGWRVQIAGRSLESVWGRHGAPVPVEVAAATVDPDRWEALFVPGGVRPEPAIQALIQAFAARALVATSAGVKVLRAAGVEGIEAADEARPVRVAPRRLTAARPGDLPGLLHALHTWAHDRRARAGP